jgi:O-antigen chain-terminating methyltransferase
MSDSFYRAFEDQYRGSRELIKSRLRVYLPFLEPLIGLYSDAKAMDLGCGRGEWLELMQETGFKPYGVDLDEGMLSSCRKLKLPVKKGDAVAFLAALPGESQAVVSAFHVVEHISFEQLQTVVSEALRVLKPGGLLIMETPNPENLIVATRSFYLDPTHLHPIPPQLLSFLPEYYGFKRVKTLRLQESAELSGGKALTVLDILDGVSPDYAIVAQKAANPEQMKSFDAVFQKNYGVSLETLAKKYEAQVETVETAVEKASAKAAAEARVRELEIRGQQSEVRMQDAMAAAEVRAQHLQGELNAAQAQLSERNAALASREAALAKEQAHSRQMENEKNADKSKMVELNQALKETLVRRHEAQIAAGKAEAQVRQLQSELSAAQTHAESLKAQLAEKVAALASREATLVAQQTHTQRLENEWSVAKEKINELSQEIKETLAQRYEAQVATVEAESRTRELQGELNETIAMLANREAALAEQQTHTQRLENEWSVAKEKINELSQEIKETLAQRYEAQVATVEAESRTRELQSELNEMIAMLASREATLTEQQARSQWLENESNAAKIKIDELNRSSHHWWTVADGLTRELKAEHERAQSLENEWDAAKVKITELNQTSHHWWTESTRLGHELQSVYHSKSWRITWPLRKLTQFFKWLGFLPVRLTRRLVSLPKRAVRRLLVKTIAFVLRHPAIKARAKSWLCRHRQLEERVRRFATAHGLVAGPWLAHSARPTSAGDETVLGAQQDGAGTQRNLFTGDLRRIAGVAVVESWGRWSNGETVKLEFEEPLPERFVLHLTAKAFGPNIGKEFVAKAGAEEVRFELRGKPETKTLEFNNPEGVREITIIVPAPTAPADISTSADIRKLGLGLCQVEISAQGKVFPVNLLNCANNNQKYAFSGENQMTPRARHIYADLKAAIEQRRKEIR